MISLAERQDAFLKSILDDSAPVPEGWGNRQAVGMNVYRGNYRSALMGALAETYERTARYVGEKAFAQASINHAIAHPPAGWTIDEAGAGFDVTCANMFSNNPEVAELAWLEWAMLELATAEDCTPITPQDFAEASAGFGEDEWSSLTLALQPRASARIVHHDLEALWRALSGDGGSIPELRLNDAKTCLAFREGERPTFILAEADNTLAFDAMRGGASYGEMIMALLGEENDPSPEAIEGAAMRSGAILGRWLNEGLIAALNP
jgi:hypothetical protein